MGNTIEMSRAVVPKNVDDGEILEMISRKVKKGFCKGKRGVDDEVDGY